MESPSGLRALLEPTARMFTLRREGEQQGRGPGG